MGRTNDDCARPRRLNAYWLGWSPSTFYRVYSIEVAALMGVRWIVYRLKR